MDDDVENVIVVDLPHRHRAVGPARAGSSARTRWPSRGRRGQPLQRGGGPRQKERDRRRVVDGVGVHRANQADPVRDRTRTLTRRCPYDPQAVVGRLPMRFMVIIKADKNTEAGVLPDEKREGAS